MISKKEKQYVYELLDNLFETFSDYDIKRYGTFKYPNIIGEKVKPYEEYEEIILTFTFRKAN